MTAYQINPNTHSPRTFIYLTYNGASREWSVTSLHMKGRTFKLLSSALAFIAENESAIRGVSNVPRLHDIYEDAAT